VKGKLVGDRTPQRNDQPYPLPVLDAFEKFSDRIAFVHGGRTTTYGEALSEIYRLAHVLDSFGLRPGDRVAFLTGNAPHKILGRFATQLLGCAHITVDHVLSPSEQAHILRDADVSAFIYDPETQARSASEVLDLCRPRVVLSLGPAVVGGVDLLELAATSPDLPITPRADPEDFARLAYTGGSTGRTKGCCHTFGAMTAHWAWQPESWSPEIAALAEASRRYLVTGSGAGAAGQDFVALALLSGGTVHLHDKFDTGATLRAIERERITAMFVGTAKLNPLLEHPDIDSADLSSLRAVVFAGSAIATRRYRQAIERFGPILHQAYGQSETGIISLLAPADLTGQERLLSAGRPQPGVAVRVQDEHGRELAAGDIGEICVRTPQLMSGYRNRPELTAEVVRNGWLRTGDLGHLDSDGYLYLVDRVKDMVIVRGENCFSRGIEDLLVRHPAVQQAAVFGVPHETDGEAVHAVVVAAPDTPVTEAELQELVRTELSPLHAPKSVAFVDEIPFTPAGKVDKKKLREPFWRNEERQIR
jgi:fatty-acyl-CoA synthase